MDVTELLSKQLQRLQGQVRHRFGVRDHAGFGRPPAEGAINAGLEVCGRNTCQRVDMVEEAATDLRDHRRVAELPKAVDVPLKHLHGRGHPEATATVNHKVHGSR